MLDDADSDLYNQHDALRNAVEAAQAMTRSPDMQRIWETFHYSARNTPPFEGIAQELEQLKQDPKNAKRSPRALVYMSDLFDLEHKALKKSWGAGDPTSKERLDELQRLKAFIHSDLFFEEQPRHTLKTIFKAAQSSLKKLKTVRHARDFRAVFANDNVTKRRHLPKDWEKLLDGIEKDNGLSSFNPLLMMTGILKHAVMDLYVFFEKSPYKATLVAAALTAAYSFYYSEIGYSPSKTDIIVTGLTDLDYQISDDGGYELTDFAFDPQQIDPNAQKANCHGHMKTAVDAFKKVGVDIEGSLIGCESFDKLPYQAQQNMIAVSNVFRTPANKTFRDAYRDFEEPEEPWLKGSYKTATAVASGVNTYNLWENRILHNFLLIFAILKTLKAGSMNRKEWKEFGDDVIDLWHSGRKANALLYAGGAAGLLAGGSALGFDSPALILSVFGGVSVGNLIQKGRAHLNKGKQHVMATTSETPALNEVARLIDQIDFKAIDNHDAHYFRVATISYLGALAVTAPAAALDFAGVLAQMPVGDLKALVSAMSYANGSMAAAAAVLGNFVMYNIPEEAVSHRAFPAMGATIGGIGLGAWHTMKAGYRGMKFTVQNPKQTAAAFLLSAAPIQVGKADVPGTQDIIIPPREERYIAQTIEPVVSND